MSRPLKSGVDYFPLDVKMDDEIELLESEHNLIGFGVLVKLYQRIYASNYWLKWDKKELIVFSKRINVDKNEVIAIINTCLEWSIFDKKLFDDYSILTSHGIQKRFFEITVRRKTVEVVEQFLLLDFSQKENDNIVFVDINAINVVRSTQRKGKESKGKENKELFALFWKKYPKKKSKGDAEKAFNKLDITEELFSKIINAVSDQSQSLDWQKENGKYIPYPATWLNSKRWDDEGPTQSHNMSI